MEQIPRGASRSEKGEENSTHGRQEHENTIVTGTMAFITT